MSTELEAVTKAVAEFDRVAAGIDALKTSYGGVVYEVATTKGMGEAKAARLAVREPRFGIEKIRAAAKAPILELGKKLDSEARRITAALLAIEEPIDQQIKSEEDRKEREKQARIDVEVKRVADISNRIDELRGNQVLTVASGSALIMDHIGDLSGIPVDDTFAEFRQQAEDAKAAALARLKALHEAAVAHEAEQARIKAEREELARLRAADEQRAATERARIAEEARIARETQAEAEREAAETRRVEQERIDAANAERERQLTAQREAQEAEDRRLQSERDRIAREQEKLRAAQVAATPAPTKQRAAPTADEIVQILSAHYEVDRSVVRKWLARLQLAEA